MKERLEKIKKLLDEAETIYHSFSNQEQDVIIGFHHEKHYLVNCLHWSVQASEELITYCDKLKREAKQ